MLSDLNPEMDLKKNSRALTAGSASNGSSDQRPPKQDVTASISKSSRPSRFAETGSRRRTGQDFSVSAEYRGNSKRGCQIKRPPPKYRNPNFDDNKTPMTKADEFEVGSLFNHGSKKQSLNHLLNFQFEPRNLLGSNNRGRASARKGNEPTSRRQKYNKEQYLQANCQFVVREGEDYQVHLVDADTLVDWNLIEQVVLKTTADVPSCPICLYPPTAAKITRCGHVFCWSCILHYLALSDDKWRKCPICYESIYRHDLKSVVSVAWKEFKVGDEIEMHLMRRDRNSLFAMPVKTYFPEVNDKHPNISERTTYSQLVTASPVQVASEIIAREKRELEDQYRVEGNEPEGCFIEEALQYIAERECGLLAAAVTSPDYDLSAMSIVEEVEINETTDDRKSLSGLLQEGDNLEVSDQEVQVDFCGRVDVNPTSGGYRPRHSSDSSDGSGMTELMPEVTAEDLDISTYQTSVNQAEETKAGVKTPKATFYFYQSSDGQPIYLHALNVQMLVKQYGSLEQCPKVIRGIILERDSTSMTQELRNRLRYLRHLPVTSTFEVCELDMKMPKFLPEVLQEFQPQIDGRRRTRLRRAREEKRRDKAITIELNKQMGKYPDPKLRIESNFHFPQVGADGGRARSTESLASADSTLSVSPGLADNSTSMSFAKMLREGCGKSTPMRSTKLPTSYTVASFPVLRNPSTVDSEPEPEDYVPPPPKANFGDVLAMALERSSLGENSGSSNGESTGSSKGKKGKRIKGQKINLTAGR